MTSSARQKPAQSVRKGFSKNEWNFQVSFIVCVKFLSNIYEDFYLLNSIPTSDLANNYVVGGEESALLQILSFFDTFQKKETKFQFVLKVTI